MTMDDIRPRPPEEHFPPPKKPPKKLDEVKPKKNHKVRFSFGDYLRFAWMVLLGVAEKQLNPMEKTIGDKTLCYLAIGFFVVLSVTIVVLLI